MSEYRSRLGKVIWTTSRADEGTISAMGANIVADALLASDVLRDIQAEAEARALRDAADDPTLRLSGHSGISIRRLRDRADRIEGGKR